MLGEDVDWLSDVALEMEPEDERLTVFGVNDMSATAFTHFEIESVKEFIELHRDNPWIIERYRKNG